VGKEPWGGSRGSVVEYQPKQCTLLRGIPFQVWGWGSLIPGKYLPPIVFQVAETIKFDWVGQTLEALGCFFYPGVIND